MKVVLVGAYGHLGIEILKELQRAGHTIIAAGRTKRDLQEYENVSFHKCDVTDPQSIKGMCHGADVVISTVGLTKASTEETNEQIDYEGNYNLLQEAKSAGVKYFVYVSVLKADQAPDVPMLETKYRFEQALVKSCNQTAPTHKMHYLIVRPTGYFYDMIHVFRPIIEKGTVTLLGKKQIHANVISTKDLAKYIVEHMTVANEVHEVGGKETWSYQEMAEMMFRAAGKKAVIKRVPVFLFDVLAWISHRRKNGKEALIRFSKWTLTQEMVAGESVGNDSFSEYVSAEFSKDKIPDTNDAKVGKRAVGHK